MARPKKQRVRLGALEAKLCKSIKINARTMPLWISQVRTHENDLNRKLKRHLENRVAGLSLVSKGIRQIMFAGENYRPEYFCDGKKAFPLCAFECKRLTPGLHKRNFKEALSQALLYASEYKRVFLVLYDFTKKRIYTDVFGPGNRRESAFVRVLRETHGIEVVSIPATYKSRTSRSTRSRAKTRAPG
jgi:hypothetical protein